MVHQERGLWGKGTKSERGPIRFRVFERDKKTRELGATREGREIPKKERASPEKRDVFPF